MGHLCNGPLVIWKVSEQNVKLKRMTSSLPWASLHISVYSVWSLRLSLTVEKEGLCTSACCTTLLYTRDYHPPLLLKVKMNALLGHFKQNLSLTFPCYLSGYLVNIDEFKCTSCLSVQHLSLTYSLVDALFASKQVIGCRINVSEKMLVKRKKLTESL